MGRRKEDEGCEAMESVRLRHAISASPVLKPKKQNRKLPFPNNTTATRLRFRPQRRTWRSLFLLPIRSKQSHFQDFQDYAKPSRLLQAEELRACTENSEEEEVLIASCCTDVSRSLYKLELVTSPLSASGLSDPNAGILVCLIDENGDSILQRISASSDVETLRFQRGSRDEFSFKGPNLGRLEALWIGLESGQWRLGKARLTVIRGRRGELSVKEEEQVNYTGVKYEFEAEDVELGEGRTNDYSMLELRPRLVTKLSNPDPSSFLARSLLPELLSNEQSMKEYADLKLSLLLYDAALVLIGASALSVVVGDHEALAFLGGGVGGFLYLVLLQRSVDGLSSPATESGLFKGPIASIALAVGLSFIAFKFVGSGDLTGKDLVFGAMGFLVCKVSAVLAAFTPVSKGIED